MNARSGSGTVADLVDTTASTVTLGIFPNLTVADLLGQLRITSIDAADDSDGNDSNIVELRTATCQLLNGKFASLLYATDLRVSPEFLGFREMATPSAVLVWNEMAQGQLTGREDSASPWWWFDVASAPVNSGDMPLAARQLIVSEAEFWSDSFDARIYATHLLCAAAGGSMNPAIGQLQHHSCRIEAGVTEFEDAEDFAAVLEMLWPELASAIQHAADDRRRAVAEFASATAIQTVLKGRDDVQEMKRGERWHHYCRAAIAADVAEGAEDAADGGDFGSVYDGSSDFDEADFGGRHDGLRTEQNAWLAAWFALDTDSYTACVGAVHGLLASVMDDHAQTQLVAILTAKLH